jgi:hypothetical protein
MQDLKERGKQWEGKRFLNWADIIIAIMRRRRNKKEMHGKG